MTRVASLYLPSWSIDRIRRREQSGTSPTATPPKLDASALLALKQAGDAEQGGKACDSPKNTGWRPGARWAQSELASDPADLRNMQSGYADPHPMGSTAWAKDDAAAMARPLAGVDEATGGAQGVLADGTRAGRGTPSRREDFIADVKPVSACWGGDTRADVERRVARLPAHQQPPMREMGRRSEAAEHAFKRLPGDDGGKSSGWPEPPMAAVRFGGEGVRPTSLQRPDLRTTRRDESRADARPSLGIAVAAWNAMSSVSYPGDGPYPDKQAAKERRPVGERRGSNDAGATVKEVAAFFDTGRSTAGTVSRVCRDDAAPVPQSSVETWYDHHRAVPYGADTGDGGRPSLYGFAPAQADHHPPLVTVHKVGSRIEVAAVSPAARALGAEPGMALTMLRAANPDIAVRDADAEGDATDLERLALALARRWSPVVALDGTDGLAIDLTGVAHLHGGEEAMATRLVRLLARMGFAARIGIADTLGAAWAIARHAAGPDARVIVMAPGAGLDALAPLPVAALRVGERAEELLRRLGVDTVGQLAALPRAPLTRRFGRIVPDRLDHAAGRLPEPLTPVIPVDPIVVEQRFAEPLLTAEPIAYWLHHLVQQLCAELAATGRGARALVLAAHRLDAAVQTIRLGFARPVRDVDHVCRLLLRQIERIDPGFGIELLALHVLRADPLGAEPLAGDLAAERQAEDIAPLVDALVNRIGPRRLWRSAPLESDVPERSVATAAPLDPPPAAATRLKQHDVRCLDRSARDHPWHPRWPRPSRLLRRPEPLDHVMAELPDYPPIRFTWRGETHVVVRGDGPERISGEWWRHTAERDAVRDYFQVEDNAGHRFWLFRRGDGERAVTGDLSWYMHGTFA